jgi:hypothetical protein
MLSRRTLSAPGRHGRNVCLQAGLLGVIGPRSQFDESMQRDLHPWGLLLLYIHEVSVDATEDSLMRDDENVLAALEFHDDGLKPDDNITIRLAADVAVVVLVFVACPKVAWVLGLDLAVCKAIANAAVEFVKSLPLQLVEGEKASRLDGSLQSGCPHSQFSIANRLFDQIGQNPGVCLAAR